MKYYCFLILALFFTFDLHAQQEKGIPQLPMTGNTDPTTAKNLPAEIPITDKLIQDVAKNTEKDPALIKVVLQQLSGGTGKLNTAKMQRMAQEFQKNGALSDQSMAGMDTAAILSKMGVPGGASSATSKSNSGNTNPALNQMLGNLFGGKTGNNTSSLSGLLPQLSHSDTSKSKQKSPANVSGRAAMADIMREFEMKKKQEKEAKSKKDEKLDSSSKATPSEAKAK